MEEQILPLTPAEGGYMRLGREALRMATRRMAGATCGMAQDGGEGPSDKQGRKRLQWEVKTPKKLHMDTFFFKLG